MTDRADLEKRLREAAAHLSAGGTLPVEQYVDLLVDAADLIASLHVAAKRREHEVGKHRGYYEACRDAAADYRAGLAALASSQPFAETVGEQAVKIATLTRRLAQAEHTATMWEKNYECLDAQYQAFLSSDRDDLGTDR
jgi:hypothetical protein